MRLVGVILVLSIALFGCQRVILVQDQGPVYTQDYEHLSPIVQFYELSLISPQELNSPPTIVGGIDSFLARIPYPRIAHLAHIEGRAIAQFKVSGSGQAVRIETLSDVGANIEEVVVRGLQMTQFEPGYQDGKAVESQMRLEVDFKLVPISREDKQ